MGAEGIDVTPGADVLLADSAEGFCDLAARALRDAELAARVGAAGRRLAEDVYDWDRIAQRLDAALGELVR
jgi:glycosyltransferase involved in cell wall biosynthesis